MSAPPRVKVTAHALAVAELRRAVRSYQKATRRLSEAASEMAAAKQAQREARAELFSAGGRP